MPDQKATNEQIIAAYRDTGSVWRAARVLGMSGQTVHERLVRLGVTLAASTWTEQEEAELRALVGHLTIGEIAKRLGRPYNGVALKISRLGIGERFGNRGARKAPRGQGYDKASTLRHARAIDASTLTFTRYARQNGLSVEMLAQCLERYMPEWWEGYRRAHSDIPEKRCPYCSRSFIPASGKQIYCSRQCASTARADASYFGGKRRQTIGLAEGVCQCCAKSTDKLSSHHVIGKQNDPENEILVALCAGCHQLVTHLGGRDWSHEQWENLIALAWWRKSAGTFDGDLWVSVEIETVGQSRVTE